jgi:putative ABC transport system substrate-binding protein
VNGAIYPLQYDVLNDFEPIALLANNPQLIVAKKSMPANDLQGLIAWLKANPNKASAGTAGVGSPQHILGVFFQNVATSVIPIVFASVGDPVGAGVVESLARPGGNATGLSLQATDAAGKRLELLRDVVPGLRRVAIMANSANSSAALEMREAETTARALGLETIRSEILRGEDITPAFDALKGRVDALYVCNDPLAATNRVRINILAVGVRLPTMFIAREYVDAGGLMSYGANFLDLYRRAAELVDKILRGARPAEIPVEQPTKFDLVVNLSTSKALGLAVPATLLARADEVIE